MVGCGDCARPCGHVLFENAPSVGVQQRLGLLKPGDLNVRRRALLVVLLGWVPSIFLAVLASLVTRSNDFVSLLREVGVHGRYLVAAPALVLAEATCVPLLNAIVWHFIGSELVPAHARARFEEAVASSGACLARGSPKWPSCCLPVWRLLLPSYLTRMVLRIRQSGGLLPIYSAAGWWHALVSLPLLLAIVLGWLWRVVGWTRLLCLIARLDLKLIASHPDHAPDWAFSVIPYGDLHSSRSRSRR